MSPVPGNGSLNSGTAHLSCPAGCARPGVPRHRKIASPVLFAGGLAMTAPREAQRRQLRPSNSSVPRNNGEGLPYANVKTVLISSGALVIAVSACSNGSLRVTSLASQPGRRPSIVSRSFTAISK